MTRVTLKLLPLGSPQRFKDVAFGGQQLTLRQLLEQAPALSDRPFETAWLDQPRDDFIIKVLQAPWDQLYLPPGLTAAGTATASGAGDESSAAKGASAGGDEEVAGGDSATATEATVSGSGPSSSDALPSAISERDAVRLTYAEEIATTASFLHAGLSVLVRCEKLVVEHLWQDITLRAKLRAQVLAAPDEDEGGLVPRTIRQRQLAHLKKLIRDLKDGDVLVIQHLDLLAGGESSMPTEARELIELVYQNSDRLILAFADPSMDVPEVLASRFAVRLRISGVPREVEYPDGRTAPLGEALVTMEEAARFQDYDPEGLYKNVAGMNPIRLRHAIKYAIEEHAHQGVVPVSRLYLAIRAFKAQTSVNFEVPDVAFDNIGGYDEVKAELLQAIQLLEGAANLPPRLQRELIPRGFIFYGPPGTGKTLFAKAVANRLNATIQVVSGPEVTDMYVGESERKVRELFAEARRNAPAVLVFDEFDSIASKRSGREDGGTRAGNALVAQILTEMDGFRPDVPILVIGTTNRLDIIDDALLRPSRFRDVRIGLPNPVARREIAVVHARHFDIQVSAALLNVLADATEGFNGDEVRSLFRDACVGLRVQQPPVAADAQRFGLLVGRIRQSHQQRAASTAAQRPSPLETTPRGTRVRPSSPMMTVAGEPAPTAAPPADPTTSSDTSPGSPQP